MADEISLTISMVATNGSFKETFSPGAVSIDQSAVGGHSPTVSISTAAEENLTFGDVSTEGIVVGRNLDSTNYVTVGPPSSGGSTSKVAWMRINAGEPFAFRLDPSAVWRWRAVGGTVLVQVKMLEN